MDKVVKAVNQITKNLNQIKAILAAIVASLSTIYLLVVAIGDTLFATDKQTPSVNPVVAANSAPVLNDLSVPRQVNLSVNAQSIKSQSNVEFVNSSVSDTSEQDHQWHNEEKTDPEPEYWREQYSQSPDEEQASTDYHDQRHSETEFDESGEISEAYQLDEAEAFLIDYVEQLAAGEFVEYEEREFMNMEVATLIEESEAARERVLYVYRSYPAGSRENAVMQSILLTSQAGIELLEDADY